MANTIWRRAGAYMAECDAKTLTVKRYYKMGNYAPEYKVPDKKLNLSALRMRAHREQKGR